MLRIDKFVLGFSVIGVLCRRTLFPETLAYSSTDTATAKMSTGSAPYVAGTHSIAYVTTPSDATAKSIARALIDRKLAACVNIIPRITSIYEWEGKVNEDEEYLLMIKTTTDRVNDLAKFVRENHPYSVAEVISVKIENGNAPYLDWIAESLDRN